MAKSVCERVQTLQPTDMDEGSERRRRLNYDGGYHAVVILLCAGGCHMAAS